MFNEVLIDNSRWVQRRKKYYCLLPIASACAHTPTMYYVVMCARVRKLLLRKLSYYLVWFLESFVSCETLYAFAFVCVYFDHTFVCVYFDAFAFVCVYFDHTFVCVRHFICVILRFAFVCVYFDHILYACVILPIIWFLESFV